MSIKYMRDRGVFVLKCDKSGCPNQIVVRDEMVFNKDQSELIIKLDGWMPLQKTIYGLSGCSTNPNGYPMHICPDCYKEALRIIQEGENEKDEEIEDLSN